MILKIPCPHCQQMINVPADFEIPCAYCARRVYAPLAEFSPRKAPRWRIAGVLVALTAIAWTSLDSRSKRPGVEAPAAVASPSEAAKHAAGAGAQEPVSADKHLVQGPDAGR